MRNKHYDTQYFDIETFDLSAVEYRRRKTKPEI